jgi:hypothetical protein
MGKLTCITNAARQDAARRGFSVLIAESLPPKRPVGGFRKQRAQASAAMKWVEFALVGAVALPALIVLLT